MVNTIARINIEIRWLLALSAKRPATTVMLHPFSRNEVLAILVITLWMNSRCLCLFSIDSGYFVFCKCFVGCDESITLAL